MSDIRLVGLHNEKPYPLLHSESMYIIDPPPMLVDQILPKQTITGLTAAPGTGKTWLAMEFMRAIATGTALINKFPCEQGSVLFVGSDASVYDYARQWKKLSIEEWGTYAPTEEEYNSGVTRYNPFDGNVRFLLQSDFLFEDLGSVRRLIRTSQMFEWGEPIETEYGPVWNRGFSLIVFDTLSKLTRMNQNDNSQMEEVFRNLRLISEQAKAGIILLHHNAYQSEFNDGESWRGASAQIGALDNWFNLSADQNNKNLITAKIKKFRGLTPDPFTYEMYIDEDKAKLTTSAPATEGIKLDDGITPKMLEWLQSPVCVGKWFSVRQVSDALWGDEFKILFGESNFEKFKRAVRNRLNEEALKTEPTVTRQGTGKRTSTVYYTAVLNENKS